MALNTMEMEISKDEKLEPLLDELISEASEANYMENESLGTKYRKKKTILSRLMEVINFFRSICGAIVENTLFQYIILLMIVVNSLMMALGTYTWVTENEKIDDWFSQADNVFLITFTVELCLQFVYRGLGLFLDGWLVFDFTTIVLSWTFQKFQVIRAFRVFRALRLITRIKVLKNLVMALGSVLPSMVGIFALLVLFLYIFAVMFTSLFAGLLDNVEEPYFSTLHNSLFTLFQMLTLDWIEITRELMEEMAWSKYPVLVFVLTSGFIVYNLFVAVLCDAIYVINKDKDDDDVSILKDEDGPRLQREIMLLIKRIEKIQEDQDKIKASVEDVAATLLYLEDMEMSNENQ